jgi:hypothetical protein
MFTARWKEFFFNRNRMKLRSGSGAGPRFVESEAYTIFVAPIYEKSYKNYDHKFRNKGEYLFRAPSQGLLRGSCK